MQFSQLRNAGRTKTVTIIILSILLFISMFTIVGLTYALYTDMGDDGKIGVTVTSGKCKIEIVDTEDNSLIGDVLDFVRNDKESIVYFEPGATYYTEGFEVKNAGDVSVNFHVYISEDERADKAEFQEAFEFWITNDPSNLKEAERLTEFTGRLKAGEKSETHYLVIRMKETAGNAFQSKTYSGIGITVYAVQANAVAE